MKLWGRTNSINVQKAMWMVGELALAVERMDVGGAFAGNDTPEYLAKNPNGRVPTLEDGDFVLWESNAIVRHLAETRGGEPWYPGDAKRRALANQWMDWGATMLNPAMRPLFWGLVRTKPEDRDQEAIKAGIDEAAGLFGILEAQLAGKDYILGNEPTMADVVVGPMVYRWLHLPMERPALGNIEAYHGRLAKRPAFREHVMIPIT